MTGIVIRVVELAVGQRTATASHVVNMLPRIVGPTVCESRGGPGIIAQRLIVVIVPLCEQFAVLLTHTTVLNALKILN
jgi:hypothetical protein